MIEKSVFLYNEIIDEVKRNYNIDVEKIEKEDRGSANIYYVYDANNKYVFKEFESRCKEQKILQEANILEHLNKNKIKTPKYIKTIDNKFYFKYKNRIIILMNFIEGYTKNPNTGNFTQTIESATLLGKITKALESFEQMECESWDKYYKNDFFDKAQKKYLDLIEKIGNSDKEQIIKNDLVYKIELVNQLKEFDLNGIENITYKNSHGDFSIMQFLYLDEKVTAVIDFERARKLPIVWEIIRSYTHIDEKCKNGDFDIGNFIKYVKEVMKYIDLNIYDLKFMPYTYLLKLAGSAYGYEEYINNNELVNLFDFGRWRTKMCKSLMKNMNEIVEKLMELK